MKISIKIAIIICLMITVTSCQTDTYKIGVLGNYKGNSKSFTEAAYNGAQLYLDLNEGMNEKYELISIDYDFQGDYASLDSVLSEKNIDIIIGPCMSNELEYIYPYLIEQDYVVFVPSASSDILNDKQDNIFRFINSTTEQAKQFAQVMEEIPNQTILIFYDNNNTAYSEVLAEGIKNNSKTIDYSLVELKDDVSNSFLEELDLNIYEKIVIIASGKKAGITIQKLRYLGYEKDVYLSAWSAGEDLVTYIGDMSEKVHVHSNAYPTYEEAYERFLDGYTSTYNITPYTSSIYSYEFMCFLDQYDDEIDITDANAITQLIQDKIQLKGNLFDIEYDANENSSIEMQMLILSEGAFIHE